MLYLFIILCIVALANCDPQCQLHEIPVTFIRKYGTTCKGETLTLYESETQPGKVVTLYDESILCNKTVKNTFCLLPRQYIFVAKSVSLYGWESSSSISVYRGSILLLKQSLRLKKHDEWSFYPLLLIDESTLWYYNSTEQNTKEWYQVSFLHVQWKWYYKDTFPDVHTITRYYRYKAILNSLESTFFLFDFSVYTKEGIIIYLNGYELVRRNMDLSNQITPSTFAIKQDDDYFYFHITGSIQQYITYSKELVFAIEIHQYNQCQLFDISSSIYNEQQYIYNSSYIYINDNECISKYTNKFHSYLFLHPKHVSIRSLNGKPSLQKISTINEFFNSTLQYSDDENIEHLFDFDYSTLYTFSSSSLYNIDYTLDDQRQEFINSYRIILPKGTYLSCTLCFSIYASNIEGSWVLLSRQSNILLDYTLESQTFYIPSNTIAFNKYRFQINYNNQNVLFHNSINQNNTSFFNTDSLINICPISEFELTFAQIEYIANPSVNTIASFQYSQTMYTWYIGISLHSLLPISSGYYNFSSSSSMILPKGISLNTFSGEITGIPEVLFSGYILIYAYNGRTYKKEQCVLYVNIKDCIQSNFLFVSLHKSSDTLNNGNEIFTLSNKNHIYYSWQPSNSTEDTDTICIPKLLYTLTLYNNNTYYWSRKSYLTILVHYKEVSLLLYNYTLDSQFQHEFLLNLNFYSYFGNSNANCLLKDDESLDTSSWYLLDYKPSSLWSTCCDQKNHLIYTNHIYFRNLFKIDSLQKIQALELFFINTTYYMNVYLNGVLQNTIYNHSKKLYTNNMDTIDDNSDTIIYDNNKQNNNLVNNKYISPFIYDSLNNEDIFNFIDNDTIYTHHSYTKQSFVPSFIILSTSLLNIGKNILAFDIQYINITDISTFPTNLPTFFSFRSVYSSNDLPRNNRINLFSTTNTTYLNNLLDHNDLTNCFFKKTLPFSPETIIMTYKTVFRHEYINKYCLVSGQYLVDEDPKDWSFYGCLYNPFDPHDKSCYLLDNVHNIHFQGRNQHYCRYIYNNNTLFNKYYLIINDISNHNQTKLTLAEIELYSETIFNSQEAPLYYKPDYIYSYYNTSFPTILPMNKYHDFSIINGTLPDGLFFDIDTGKITGSPIFRTDIIDTTHIINNRTIYYYDSSFFSNSTTKSSQSTYYYISTGSFIDNHQYATINLVVQLTIQAYNLRNESSITTIIINFCSCASQYTIIDIVYHNPQQTFSNTNFYLFYDSETEQIIHSRNYFEDWNDMTSSICIPLKPFTIVLADTDNLGWNQNYIELYSKYINLFFKETISYGESPKSYEIQFSTFLLKDSIKWIYFNHNKNDTNSSNNNKYNNNKYNQYNNNNNKYNNNNDNNISSSEPIYFPVNYSWLSYNYEDRLPEGWSIGTIDTIGFPLYITQYYVYPLALNSIQQYSALKYEIGVFNGFIAYLNGYEIHRYNMPENVTVYSETLALSESDKKTYVSSIIHFQIPAQFTDLYIMHFAIEIHRGCDVNNIYYYDSPFSCDDNKDDSDNKDDKQNNKDDSDNKDDKQNNKDDKHNNKDDKQNNKDNKHNKHNNKDDKQNNNDNKDNKHYNNDDKHNNNNKHFNKTNKKSFLDSPASSSLLDISLYILPNSYSITTQGYSYSPYYGQSVLSSYKHLFDHNYYTEWFVHDICNNIYIEYIYPPGISTYISRYTIISSYTCNQYTPSGWQLLGSNDGKVYESIDIQLNILFTHPKETKSFYVLPDHPYNRYRINFVQCNNINLNDEEKDDENICSFYNNAFHLCAIEFFVTRYEHFCIQKNIDDHKIPSSLYENKNYIIDDNIEYNIDDNKYNNIDDNKYYNIDDNDVNIKINHDSTCHINKNSQYYINNNKLIENTINQFPSYISTLYKTPIDTYFDTTNSYVVLNGNSININCGPFQTGLINQICFYGQFLEQDTSQCKYIPPSSFRYPQDFYIYIYNTTIFPIIPQINTIYADYSISPSLPNGLLLDPNIGVLYGQPVELIERKSYIIKAANNGGYTATSIELSIINTTNSNYCYPEGIWSFAYRNTIQYHDCPKGYTGILYRKCSLTIPAQWEDPIDQCILENTIITLSYPFSIYVFKPNTYINISPITTGNITSWSITPNSLPSGLSFNTYNGTISGSCDSVTNIYDFTIKAKNKMMVSFDLSIKIHDPICPGDINWPNGYPGQSLTMDCKQYSMSGTEIRKCDEKSLNWKVIEKTCKYTVLSISYSSSSYLRFKYMKLNTFIPIITGIATSFSIYPPLPNGLYFDNKTGSIYGIPQQIKNNQQYIVTISNKDLVKKHNIVLTIYKSVCKSIDIWPETLEDTYSIVPCESPYQVGYRNRTCQQGIESPLWGNITDSCIWKQPIVSYPSSMLSFYINDSISILPSVQNYVTDWSITPSLPKGLVLDKKSGNLYGIALCLSELKEYKIMVSNPSISILLFISISITNPRCEDDNEWNSIFVDERLYHFCNNNNHTIQYRDCLLNRRNNQGIWTDIYNGTCLERDTEDSLESDQVFLDHTLLFINKNEIIKDANIYGYIMDSLIYLTNTSLIKYNDIFITQKLVTNITNHNNRTTVSNNNNSKDLSLELIIRIRSNITYYPLLNTLVCTYISSQLFENLQHQFPLSFSYSSFFYNKDSISITYPTPPHNNNIHILWIYIIFFIFMMIFIIVFHVILSIFRKQIPKKTIIQSVLKDNDLFDTLL
ncbi:hypothetical protein WA158_007214 [Blastocystis sp. Blastoise]